MSKASAVRYIDQVIDVIIKCLGKKFIRLPNTAEEWNEFSAGFEAVCGFPDTCLAVDGSLFEIERPADYEGWYCRKGYPAINAQIVVDYKKRIRDYCLRSGSENDKGVFNRSNFGRNIGSLLPANKMIIADAGYQLFTFCMIPYEISDNMTRKEKNYNYLHSRTRISVEVAIGFLKGRFRIFKRPLNQKGNVNNGHINSEEKVGVKQMAKLITACFILHNMLIDMADDTVIEMEPDANDAEPRNWNLETESFAGQAAKQNVI